MNKYTMSVINQSVHFNNSKVFNSRIQSKCCVKSFVSMLSPIKETLKKPKGHRVNCQLTR